MDLRALQIFKAVVDEGGITRAAERLHCVQSNVSIRIRQLEDLLGTCLFERVGNRLTVTPRGAVLHGYAVRLLRLAEEARLAVTGTGALDASLRIGTIATAATMLVPRALTEFHRSHPSVRLQVNVATTDNIVRNVLEQNLEIGLVVDAISNPALQKAEIHEDELILVTDREHRLICSAKDLRSTMIIGFRDGCTYRDRVMRWMAESRIPLPRILELDTIEAIIGCVAAGLGAAVLPRGIVEHSGFATRIQCHGLPDRYSKVKTVMIWHANSRHQNDHHALAERFRVSAATPTSEPAAAIVER